ncbi:MAG: hypothetical protein ABSF55_03130, partial [Candidatus Staskawiczbacteria bacterium]
EGILVSSLAREIKKRLAILKRGILRIFRSLRQGGANDGYRMYFYRLMRKFLPAFFKAWRLDI